MVSPPESSTPADAHEPQGQAGLQPLYARVLGSGWSQLPDQIRAMHQCHGILRASGLAQVDRGEGLLARLVGAIIGFPQAGQDVPVTVRFSSCEGVEHWVRTFAGRSFSSWQREAKGRSGAALLERFGPLTFELSLTLKSDRLYLDVAGWSLLGLPLPRVLAPRGLSFESVADNRFNFHVEISHPLTDLIVRYRGWLVPGA